MSVVGTVYGTEYVVSTDEADRVIAGCEARGDLFEIRRTWDAFAYAVTVVSRMNGRVLALFTVSAG